MRVRIFSYLYRPDHAGGASIFTDLAEGLAERGHEVSVVCAYPFYPEWSKKSEDSPWRRRTEMLNGVRIERHGMFIPGDPSSLLHRALYEASFLLSQLRSTRSGPSPDVVIAFAPLVSSVAVGVLTSFIRRRPLWIHVQDVSSGGAASFDSGGRAQRALAGVESWLLQRGDRLTTISPVMARGLTRLTNRSDVDVIPNWLHSELENKIRDLGGKLERSPDEIPELLYAGNIGLKQGLDQLVTELHQSTGAFRLTIYGTGSGADRLDDVLAKLGDERFIRGPFLSEEDFARRLLAADLFLVSELDTGEAAFLPSKLVPAAACGCPILAVCGEDSPIRIELDQHGTGRWLPWESLSTIEVRLQEMLTDEARKHFEIQTKARARSLGSSAALDRIEALLGELTIQGT